jgi:ribosomal protein L37AE/L43A
METTYTCPKGHASTEPDFCSECGAKIQGAHAAPAAQSGNGKCPDCGADRAADGSVFCEVCGYNFAAGAHGEIPVAPASAKIAPPKEEPAAPPPPPKGWTATVAVDPSLREPESPAPPPKGWTVSVAVDPSLREPESPAPPANVEPFTVSLDKPVSLIGRRSESRAVFPEIALNFDGAVSHRHALLERADSGALMLRDIGAANGTRLNGKDVPSLVDMPLQDGDEITLGYWTRITVKAVS